MIERKRVDFIVEYFLAVILRVKCFLVRKSWELTVKKWYLSRWRCTPEIFPNSYFFTGSTPLKNKEYGLSDLMTYRLLGAIGEIGGSRCCKRNLFLAIQQAVSFAKDDPGVEMEIGENICSYSPMNDQRIGKRCPFNRVNHS